MARRRVGIGAFIVICYGFAWLPALARHTVGSNAVIDLIVGLLGAVSPTVAAVVVVRWISSEGPASIAWGPRRSSPFLWLIAALIPVIAAIASGTILDAAGTFTFPHSDLSVPDRLVTGAWFSFGIALAEIFGLALLEETGWRGYLQPRVFSNRPLISATVVGVIWTVWHFPYLLWHPYIPSEHRSSVLLFGVSNIAISIVMGWLTSRSGTIWTAAVMHASYNVVIGFGGLLSIATLSTAAIQTTTFSLTCIALLVLAAGGARPAPLSIKTRAVRSLGAVAVIGLASGFFVANQRSCASWNDKLVMRLDAIEVLSDGGVLDRAADIRNQLEEERPAGCQAEA